MVLITGTALTQIPFIGFLKMSRVLSYLSSGDDHHRHPLFHRIVSVAVQLRTGKVITGNSF